MESKTEKTYLKNKLPLWRNNKNINKTKTATNLQPQRKPTKLKISKVKKWTHRRMVKSYMNLVTCHLEIGRLTQVGHVVLADCRLL